MDPINQIRPEVTNTGNTQDGFDIFTPETQTKKPSRLRYIVGFFGLFILVCGVVIGVMLVQQQQEVRERAANGSECTNSLDCELLENPGNSGSYSPNRTITSVYITAKDYVRFDIGSNNDGCYKVNIEGTLLTWERVGQDPVCKDINNIQVWFSGAIASPTQTPSSTPANNIPCKYCQEDTCQTQTATCSDEKNQCTSDKDCTEITQTPSPSPEPTKPPSKSIGASCNEIKVYDLKWNEIQKNELSTLEAGSKIRFAVSGTTNSGSIDKARFTVNSIKRAEVTQQKPNSNEFYDEYTIPNSVVNFTVKAEIYHNVLGWF